MSPLRTAAVVMLAIAATDGIVDLIEYVTDANLWRVLLAAGLVVLMADLAFDKRSELGRRAFAGVQQIGASLRRYVEWLIKTTYGTKLADKPQTKRKSAAPSNGSSEQPSQGASTTEAS